MAWYLYFLYPGLALAVVLSAYFVDWAVKKEKRCSFRLLLPGLRGKDYVYYYKGDIAPLFDKSEEHLVVLEENFQDKIHAIELSLRSHFDATSRFVTDFGDSRLDFIILRLIPRG